MLVVIIIVRNHTFPTATKGTDAASAPKNMSQSYVRRITRSAATVVAVHISPSVAECCRQSSSSRESPAPSTAGPTHFVDTIQDHVNTLFMGEVVAINSLSQKRYIFRDVIINNTPVSAKLDTGAECRVISLKTYSTILARSKLSSTDMLIQAYGMRELIKPISEAVIDVEFPVRNLPNEFIIIDFGDRTLLVIDACETPGLVQIVDAVDSTTMLPLIDEYADVFSGLGDVGRILHRYRQISTSGDSADEKFICF